MTEINSDSTFGLTTRRIEALTDGVFAIAMTLLVLNLNLPLMPKEQLSQLKLHHLLMEQTDKFINYILSFVLLAVFWIRHHQQFHYIKKTDWRHLWINILILIFIALVPFSTSLADHYPMDWMSEFFFSSNMFILGILFSCNWHYATQNYRLVEPGLDSKHIALGKRRGMVVPVISLMAMIAAFLKPSLCSYVYLLIPIILSLRFFRSGDVN